MGLNLAMGLTLAITGTALPGSIRQDSLTAGSVDINEDRRQPGNVGSSMEAGDLLLHGCPT